GRIETAEGQLLLADGELQGSPAAAEERCAWLVHSRRALGAGNDPGAADVPAAGVDRRQVRPFEALSAAFIGQPDRFGHEGKGARPPAELDARAAARARHPEVRVEERHPEQRPSADGGIAFREPAVRYRGADLEIGRARFRAAERFDDDPPRGRRSAEYPDGTARPGILAIVREHAGFVRDPAGAPVQHGARVAPRRETSRHERPVDEFEPCVRNVFLEAKGQLERAAAELRGPRRTVVEIQVAAWIVAIDFRFGLEPQPLADRAVDGEPPARDVERLAVDVVDGAVRIGVDGLELAAELQAKAVPFQLRVRFPADAQPVASLWLVGRCRLSES